MHRLCNTKIDAEKFWRQWERSMAGKKGVVNEMNLLCKIDFFDIVGGSNA
jgi:hypothetical protein